MPVLVRNSPGTDRKFISNKTQHALIQYEKALFPSAGEQKNQLANKSINRLIRQIRTCCLWYIVQLSRTNYTALLCYHIICRMSRVFFKKLILSRFLQDDILLTLKYTSPNFFH